MRKYLGTVVALLLGSACLVYAMGHKVRDSQEDTTFDAKAEGAKNPHVADAEAEDKPVGLPATPSDVEKDTAKDFHDPFFKETEKDPDLETEKK